MTSGIVTSNSKEVHSIGKDVYSFLLDEANFLQSKTGDDQGLAYAIYTNARRRLNSRFMQEGGSLPGKVWLISSKRDHSAFLENHIKEAKKDISEGRTRIYEYNQWEVRAHMGKYKMPKFRVEVGDRQHPSRILPENEDARPGADIITVPGEYRGDFEGNIDGAMRDIAGRSTASLCPLIQDPNQLVACVAVRLQADGSPVLDKDDKPIEEFVHPFLREEIFLSTEDDIQLASYFRPEVMFQVRDSQYVLRRHPSAPRFLHVDTAFTADSLGLACCHQSGYRNVRRSRPDGTFYEDRAPIIEFDFLLRVRPPARGEIDLSKVRGFILNLRDMGLPIWRVSYDGHQSRSEIQTLRKLDLDAVVYSVDRTDEAYMALKQGIMERRASYYHYGTFMREMRELERDIEECKVDHPKRSPETGEPGSKDVSDAAAGSFFQAMSDLRAPGAAVPHLSAHDNIDRRYKAPGGEIAWEALERDSR